MTEPIVYSEDDPKVVGRMQDPLWMLVFSSPTLEVSNFKINSDVSLLDCVTLKAGGRDGQDLEVSFLSGEMPGEDDTIIERTIERVIEVIRNNQK